MHMTHELVERTKRPSLDEQMEAFELEEGDEPCEPITAPVKQFARPPGLTRQGSSFTPAKPASTAAAGREGAEAGADDQEPTKVSWEGSRSDTTRTGRRRRGKAAAQASAPPTLAGAATPGGRPARTQRPSLSRAFATPRVRGSGSNELGSLVAATPAPARGGGGPGGAGAGSKTPRSQQWRKLVVPTEHISFVHQTAVSRRRHEDQLAASVWRWRFRTASRCFAR